VGRCVGDKSLDLVKYLENNGSDGRESTKNLGKGAGEVEGKNLGWVPTLARPETTTPLKGLVRR
jgi:hypothetical protein